MVLCARTGAGSDSGTGTVGYVCLGHVGAAHVELADPLGSTETVNSQGWKWAGRGQQVLLARKLGKLVSLLVL